MRWLLLGAVLGALFLFPQMLAAVVAVLAVLVTQPVVVAFVLGLAARPYLPLVGRWSR